MGKSSYPEKCEYFQQLAYRSHLANRVSPTCLHQEAAVRPETTIRQADFYMQKYIVYDVYLVYLHRDTT